MREQRSGSEPQRSGERIYTAISNSNYAGQWLEQANVIGPNLGSKR